MVSIDRSTSGHFAYAAASSSYTLRNNSASKTFLFGNPTMAYIDLKKFAEENNLPGGFIELVPGESTTLELSQTVDGLSNTGRSLDYLPPYRAVLFEAADTEGTELEVVVTADMLGHAPTTGQSMSVKRMRTDNNESLMYISASTVDYVSRALVAEHAGASDWVVKGEDAESTQRYEDLGRTVVNQRLTGSHSICEKYRKNQCLLHIGHVFYRMRI